MELHYRIGGRIASVKIARADGRFSVTVGERVYEVEVLRAEKGEIDLRIGGRPLRAFVAESGACRHVKAGDADPVALVRAETRREAAPHRPPGGGESLTANMHGQVVAVLVREGDRVERGQTLVILEAMKMELRIAAPHAGRIKLVACKAGDVVERGRALVEIEPERET